MMYQASLTSKGQVTIPIEIRKKLGLSKNSKVTFVSKDSKVYIEPAEDFLALRGILKGKLKKKYSDEYADEAVKNYIKKEYENKENSN